MANPGYKTFKLRRGPTTTWNATNPTLAAGEPGAEYNTVDGVMCCEHIRVGDGSTPWNSLRRVGQTTYKVSGQPANTLGQDADLAFDWDGGVFYGRKTTGAWPAGKHLWPGTVTVNALANGSTPTGAYDASTGTLTLGIPAAKDGANGKDGSPGAPGQSIKGDKGDTGQAGATGPAGLNWRGAYNAATAYVVNDAVSYQGGSYRCTAATTGNVPTNASYWAVVAQAGTPGTNGINGAAGQSVTSATATTLPAGSAATASYNTSTGVLTLGLPKGDQGVKGDTGAPGADSLKPATDPTPVTVPTILLAGTVNLVFTVPGATPSMVAYVYPVDATLLTSMRFDPPVITADTVTVKATALLAITTATTKYFRVRVFR